MSMDEECSPTERQARQLYKLCDPENRGFLTREDLARLCEVLPFTEEQLDAVFTSLDQDGDEHLTYEEFLDGLGKLYWFFIDKQCPYLGSKPLTLDSGEEEPSRADSRDESEWEDSFKQSFQQLGESGLVNDIESIREVWKKLRNESPALLGEFEKLLTSLAKELTHSKTEYEGLEAALKKRINEHEEEVRHLYEEMETQIKQERERLLLQEKQKEREIRDSLEGRIKEKDKLLNEILRQQEEVGEHFDLLSTICTK
ncbi:unnamed protein product [Dibothriocephalus latus]|uniref:EF-hand domain-containing protein n=1 Tax=Dibothriocephalus latus TaxID=60516 RepID=A0A3P7L6C6_DIBLA|nr:unnamed protein product [Dibothriocephalus latus]